MSKIIITEAQFNKLNTTLNSKLTPEMVKFYQYNNEMTGKLNILYNKITFMSVGDLINEPNSFDELRNISSICDNISSVFHNLYLEATKMFNKDSSLSDEEYDKEWYDIDYALNDTYRLFNDKVEIIRDIIYALDKISEINKIDAGLFSDNDKTIEV